MTFSPWQTRTSVGILARCFELKNGSSSGAVAALLYTTTAEACLINPEYADTNNFNRILDIYTTVRKSSAK